MYGFGGVDVSPPFFGKFLMGSVATMTVRLTGNLADSEGRAVEIRVVALISE